MQGTDKSHTTSHEVGAVSPLIPWTMQEAGPTPPTDSLYWYSPRICLVVISCQHLTVHIIQWCVTPPFPHHNASNTMYQLFVHILHCTNMFSTLGHFPPPTCTCANCNHPSWSLHNNVMHIDCKILRTRWGELAHVPTPTCILVPCHVWVMQAPFIPTSVVSRGNPPPLFRSISKHLVVNNHQMLQRWDIHHWSRGATSTTCDAAYDQLHLPVHICNITPLSTQLHWSVPNDILAAVALAGIGQGSHEWCGITWPNQHVSSVWEQEGWFGVAFYMNVIMFFRDLALQPQCVIPTNNGQPVPISCVQWCATPLWTTWCLWECTCMSLLHQ